MHLITGHSGTAHITSANDGAVNAHVFGEGSYVFNTREKFEASIISNNEIRVKSGEGLHNGRYFEVASSTYETASIDNGAIGTNRIDLIVARYQKDGETNIETMSLVVIKGTAATVPEVPSYNTASVLNGATISDFPLYKVTIEGLTVKSLTSLFTIRKDIVTDVAENNASTLALIKEDNATTLTKIKEDNATTKSNIATNNAATVTAIQTSNAATVAAIDEKVAGLLTCVELWTNTSEVDYPDSPFTHTSINGCKYVEYVYNVSVDSEIEGDPASVVGSASSGMIPVKVANGEATASSRASVVKPKATMELGLYIDLLTASVETVNGESTIDYENRTLSQIGSNVEIDLEESERLVLYKILGYKSASTITDADEEAF